MSGATLRFLPWVRAGAVQVVEGADALSGALPANAILKPWIEIAGHDPIEQTLALRGPGHVVSLAAQAIAKAEPRDGTLDFEPNYFPFVELIPADVPWRFTPAAPGTDNQLRPWLVLVIVRQQDGVRIINEADVPLPVLHIEAPARPSKELPDLRDSAAWAHVQTHLDPKALPDALAGDPTAAVARLLCPRQLVPDSAWLACLVPAFDVGVHAGLGEDGAIAANAKPAWDVKSATLDAAVLRLPVYYHWSFSTGPSGDFESLARRLQPDEGETRLGRVDLDISRPGPPLPAPPFKTTVIADFVGALRSKGVGRRDATGTERDWLGAAIEKVVNEGARHLTVPEQAPANYVPLRDDPVVTPPLYGSFQGGRDTVPLDKDPTRAWMRPLNLLPELRAIAGLGAAIVRAGQESLVASAWAQAGDIRGTQRVVDQGRLAAEAGRSLARRVAGWSPGAILQATARIQPWITSPASTKTLAVDLDRSALPRALTSPSFARATRPRAALGRAWSSSGKKPGARGPALSSTTETFLAATSPSADAGTRATLDFAKTALPVGAWTRDEALEADPTVIFSSATPRGTPGGAGGTAHVTPGLASPVVITGPISGQVFDSTLDGAVRLEHELREVLGGRSTTAQPIAIALDLSTAAASVMTQIDPLRGITAGLLSRVPALQGLLAADGALPGRLDLHPIFSDPLSWDLIRLDPRFMLPGAEKLPNNRIALLEADNDFVAALLTGANHEMGRELVWREFPTSPQHTFFQRFWDTGDNGRDDTGAISSWKKRAIGANLTGVTAKALTMIALRGDLVRRYPDAHIYLTRGVWWNGKVKPDTTQETEALLHGALDRRTVFYGFGVSSDDMRGARQGTSRKADTAGWFITIEEPSHGPRFGFDAAADDGSDLVSGASAWGDLSWGHLVPQGGSLDDVPFAVARTALPTRTPATIAQLTWGHNAAHMAGIAWQVPFRLFIHADRLLPARSRS